MRLTAGVKRGTLTLRFTQMGTVSYRCTICATKALVGQQ
jgi:hypothetical protein